MQARDGDSVCVALSTQHFNAGRYALINVKDGGDVSHYSGSSRSSSTSVLYILCRSYVYILCRSYILYYASRAYLLVV